MESTQCLPSSSSPSTCRRWDVFLSFTGVDTRPGFVDHLYAALEWNGIKTFKDDRAIEIGDSVRPKLMTAIEESMSAIIVFSTNYADSTWCLDELVKIVECKDNEKMKLTVLPIFYHVKPSVVREQKDTFGVAIAEHEKRFREKVEGWRTALTEVASISGEEVPVRYETEVIKSIIRICQLLSKCPRVTKGLVGITSQVEKLKLNLDLKSNDVRVIGIWGMGGIGKTTLAQAVYDTFSVEFDGCSFIEKVKERNLLEVQQELLSSICNGKNTPIWDVRDGVKRIENSLCSKKFLLVLDDVSKKGQLEKLVEWNWFGPNSRIIITTRDRHLFTILKVHDDDIHECEGLNDSNALELFCLKAFEKEQPKQGYEDLSKKIVRYASGLPLALVTLGDSLVDKEIDYWEGTLKILKDHPETSIFENLKKSYDELSYDANRKIFIYIACFLNGKNKNLVKEILCGLGVEPDAGMVDLKEKSLITISNDIVWVHDLLEQMGWEILHQQPFETRAGLKFRKDIVDVLTNNKGPKTIEIINQELSMKKVANRTCNPKAFSKMSKLIFLKISDVHFSHDIRYLSNELRILKWEGYPSKALPSKFTPSEIYELQMCSSKIEKLWEGAMEFNNLGFIDLCGSTNLTQTPDLSLTPNLKHLDMSNCTKLVEVHKSIFVHKSLNCLNLAACTSLKLQRVPNEIKMKSLKTLNLSSCSSVERIPEFGEDMESLQKLYLHGSTNLTQTPDLSRTPKLKHLDLSSCSNLVEVHGSLFVHGSLNCLNLARCTSLKLERFQNEIKMKSLKTLNLSGCSSVERIPEFGKDMKSLHELYLDWTAIKRLPSSIEHLTCLALLYARNCTNLAYIPCNICDLRSLKVVKFSKSLKLEKLPENLEEIVCWQNLEPVTSTQTTNVKVATSNELATNGDGTTSDLENEVAEDLIEGRRSKRSRQA